jgi:hypothetical protein
LSRARTAAELAAVYALLIAMLWRIGGAWTTPLCGVAIAAIVLASWRRRRATAAELGLAPRQWGRGWASAAAPTLVGVALLGALGLALGTVSLAEARFSWLGDYALGIAGQQLLLQGFFAPGFAALLGTSGRGDRLAVGASTAAFVGLHAPNPGLMLGVGAACAFWVLHFQRHRNLLAVLASHLALGLAAMVSLGPGPLWNLRVGAGAFELMTR